MTAASSGKQDRQVSSSIRTPILLPRRPDRDVVAQELSRHVELRSAASTLYTKSRPKGHTSEEATTLIVITT